MTISIAPNAIHGVAMEVFTATLAFSPGVTSGLPEPASWALMLAGVGALGARLHAGRRTAAA